MLDVEQLAEKQELEQLWDTLRQEKEALHERLWKTRRRMMQHVAERQDWRSDLATFRAIKQQLEDVDERWWQMHEKWLPLEEAESAARVQEEAGLEALLKEMEAEAAKAETMTERAKPQKRWQLKLREVDEICDALGKPVDVGIRETVAILQLLGLHTRQSCEGHIGWGLPAPWVALYVPEAEKLREEIEPLENWLEVLQEDDEAFERVCHERNRLRQDEEQYEAQAWMLLFSWLEIFYQRHRTVPYDERIVLHRNGRLTIQGAMVQGARDTATQTLKLQAYQAEMRRFTQFLKRQFLRNKF
jgi:hypothetical protein